MEKINELVNENLVEGTDEVLFVDAPKAPSFGKGLAIVAAVGLVFGGIYFGVKKFKKSRKVVLSEPESCGDVDGSVDTVCCECSID